MGRDFKPRHSSRDSHYHPYSRTSAYDIRDRRQRDHDSNRFRGVRRDGYRPSVPERVANIRRQMGSSSPESSPSVPSYSFTLPSSGTNSESEEEGEIKERPSSRRSSLSSDSFDYRDVVRTLEIKLSDRLFHPDVRFDEKQKRYYDTEINAYQFDLQLPYVRQMLRHMYSSYDTVAIWSLSLLRKGDVIYFLEAFPLGLHQQVKGLRSSRVGGRDCTAAVQLKGRFGIVLNVFGETIKVAKLTTFEKKSLAEAKPQRLWPEYVGIRYSDDRGYQHPSQAINEPLEVGSNVCDIASEKTSVHLVPTQIARSNQIMLAGHITSDSFSRLESQIKAVETRGSR